MTISADQEPFDGDARLFRLGVEAHRLGLAYEYDPFFSLSIARVDPLPHQLEAVYDYFLRLPRIRFLLADDPGAGKTIMAGLLIKELKARGLIRRTLIVTPAMEPQFAGDPTQRHPFALERPDVFEDRLSPIRSGRLRPWRDDRGPIFRRFRRRGKGGSNEPGLLLKQTLDDLAEVDEQVKPVRDLNGVRGGSRRRLGIRGGPVPADYVDSGSLAQPGDERVRGPVRQQIDDSAPLQVNQDGAVGMALTKREVVDPQDSRGGRGIWLFVFDAT